MVCQRCDYLGIAERLADCYSVGGYHGNDAEPFYQHVTVDRNMCIALRPRLLPSGQPRE